MNRLRVVKAIKIIAFTQQFRQWSFLHQFPLIKDKNSVARFERIKPVGNNKTSSVSHHRHDRFVNDFLVKRIDVGRGLIQDKNGWIFQENSCQRNQLPLTN